MTRCTRYVLVLAGAPRRPGLSPVGRSATRPRCAPRRRASRRLAPRSAGVVQVPRRRRIDGHDANVREIASRGALVRWDGPSRAVRAARVGCGGRHANASGEKSSAPRTPCSATSAAASVSSSPAWPRLSRSAHVGHTWVVGHRDARAHQARAKIRHPARRARRLRGPRGRSDGDISTDIGEVSGPRGAAEAGGSDRRARRNDPNPSPRTKHLEWTLSSRATRPRSRRRLRRRRRNPGSRRRRLAWRTPREPPPPDPSAAETPLRARRSSSPRRGTRGSAPNQNRDPSPSPSPSPRPRGRRPRRRRDRRRRASGAAGVDEPAPRVVVSRRRRRRRG